MSVSQGYKKTTEFTLPVEGADLVRKLISDRLVIVAAAMDDANAPKCFKPSELTALAFERLMLAKMQERMNSAAPNCGACPGDGSICKTACRHAAENPETENA